MDSTGPGECEFDNLSDEGKEKAGGLRGGALIAVIVVSIIVVLILVVIVAPIFEFSDAYRKSFFRARDRELELMRQAVRRVEAKSTSA